MMVFSLLLSFGRKWKGKEESMWYPVLVLAALELAGGLVLGSAVKFLKQGRHYLFGIYASVFILCMATAARMIW